MPRPLLDRRRLAATGRLDLLLRPAGLALLLVVALSQAAQSQQSILGGREPAAQYPSQQYYVALEVYREGDLEQAVELFEDAMRRTRRDINGQWIDAIPVYAMQAECYWHLGNLPACRASLDQALRIAIAYRGWLSQPDWDSATRGNVQLAPERGLWPAAAAVRRIPMSDRMMFRSGEQLSAQSVLRGGAIEEPNIKLIDVAEVMRGLAIASYRRRILLGPLSEGEPLATSLLEATKYPAGLNAPFPRALIGSMRATERFATKEDGRVLTDASNNAMFSGAAHPLTPLALLASASAMAEGENPASAIGPALQAANAAGALGQYEWVGEALQLAAGCAGPGEVASVRQLAESAAQAMTRDRTSRLAILHCLLVAADAGITAGQLNEAGQLLSAARSLASRRDVAQPRLDAYGGYLSARLAAAQGESLASGSGNLDRGLAVLDAFAFQLRFRNRPIVSMPRIYQLELVRESIGGTLGGNQADELLQQYVQDPPPEAWRRDPVDALASALHDRTAAEMAWVDLAALQTDGKDLVRRVDWVLGSRFLRRLPLAGRLAQVRQLASADPSLLFGRAKEFRDNPPPAFAELRQAVGAGAAPQPLEAAACRVALERNPIPRSFPPPLVAEDVAQTLPEGVAMATFFFAGNRLHVALAADGKTTLWTIPGANRLPRDIAAVLRGIGVGKTRGKRLPEDGRWKEDAAALRDRLFPDEASLLGREFRKLIIVPDGPLWYLPFELLPSGDSDSPLLGDVVNIRYAATPGLALHPVSLPTANRRVGVVSSGFFAPRDAEANEQAVESITEVLAEPVRLPAQEPVPGSLLGSSIGHLFVGAPQAADPEQPLRFSVAAYDASSPGGSLGAWIRFPAASPQSVILAGFRTPVGMGRMGTGQELFMTLCGLQAAGVRDVMISRWAVGGRSTATLMRELLQELPFTGMADAWQRSRGLAAQTELDPSAEPLLTQAEHKRQGVTGAEPLFWASYLVSSPLGPDDDAPKAAREPIEDGADRPAVEAEPPPADVQQPPVAVPPPGLDP